MARTLPPLDAEFALAAACALCDDTALGRAAPALLARPGFDWERFETLAFYHEVEQVALARLKAAAPAAIPGDVAERIRQAGVGQAALQAAQAASAARLTRVLSEAGVPSLLIKGVGLAHLLYAPHPEWRASNDIDIVIAPGDLDAADRALLGAGLTRQWPEKDPPAAARAMLRRLANVYEYRGAVLNELVELHARPTNNPYWMPVAFADLIAAASEVETPQGGLRVLDGPLNAHYLCQHAIYNLIDYRLKWFADIARAVQRGGARDCASYIAQYPAALPPGPGRLAGDVLRALAEGIEAAVQGRPAPVRAGTDAARIVRRMVRAEGIPWGRNLSQLPVELAFNSLVMRHLPGWRGKARQLLLMLAQPRDAVTLRLSPRFAIVYCLIGPALSLARYGTRARKRSVR